MSQLAITFITYLWHYLIARLLYEHVVRPLTQGHGGAVLLIGVAAVAAFALGMWTGRRRTGASPPGSARRRR